MLNVKLDVGCRHRIQVRWRASGPGPGATPSRGSESFILSRSSTDDPVVDHQPEVAVLERRSVPSRARAEQTVAAERHHATQ
eukprot:1046541-Rhodomonas_salina.4